MPTSAVRTRRGPQFGATFSVWKWVESPTVLITKPPSAALRPDLLGVQVTVLGMMQRLLELRTAAWYDNQSAGAIARDLIGGKVTREAGPVKGGTTVIAFVTDPDGYKVELIQR